MTQAIVITDNSDAPIGLHALTASAEIAAEYVIPYGRDVTKIGLRALKSSQYMSGSGVSNPRYIVVIAVTPAPFREGKTTTAIRLTQELSRLGQQTILALRQSAIGPTSSIKGGAGGSGDVRILSVERMNLHLTSDFRAIAAAHNLLSAMIGNHLYHDDELGIGECAIT